MTLTSDALDSRGFFDPRYTCDFDNSSPELRWNDPPEGSAGFVITFEDLDASAKHRLSEASAPHELTITPVAHWIVYMIPGQIRHLPAGIPPQESLPNGIRQGVNGLGKLGYTGPCPGYHDRPHRYVFRIYALRTSLEIPMRASRDQVIEIIKPAIITSSDLMGRYQRLAKKAG